MLNALPAGKSLSQLELFIVCSINVVTACLVLAAGWRKSRLLSPEEMLQAAGEHSAVRAKQMSSQGGIPRSARGPTTSTFQGHGSFPSDAQC